MSERKRRIGDEPGKASTTRHANACDELDGCSSRKSLHFIHPHKYQTSAEATSGKKRGTPCSADPTAEIRCSICRIDQRGRNQTSGFIEYNGSGVNVHSSLVGLVLHE